MNRKIIGVAVIVLVLLVSSFSIIYWTNVSQPNTTEVPPETVQIVDLAIRTVSLTVPVKTVVIGDQNTVNAFAAVGGEHFIDSVVGISTDFHTNYPDQYAAYADAYPKFAELTTVGSLLDSSFSVETIVGLHPDVVILPLWAKAYNTIPDLSALDAANIPYLYVDFFLNPYSGDSYNKSVSLLGTLLGQNERATNIVNFYNQQLNDIFSVFKNLDNSTASPTAYIEWPNAGANNYGPTMVNMGMAIPLKYARGTNIAEGTIVKQGTINGEFLISKNPDVIFFCVNSPDLKTSSGESVIGFGAHPSSEELQSVVSSCGGRDGWSNLDAVKNGKVYFWYSGLSFSITNFAALQYMAKCLYPNLFPNLNPTHNLQYFYTEYMPIQLDGTWTFQSDAN